MSQQHHYKNINADKDDSPAKKKNIQEKINETGKKVNKGRSKSNTDQLVKNKIMGTD